jgi:hypothetical protein
MSPAASSTSLSVECFEEKQAVLSACFAEKMNRIGIAGFLFRLWKL